MNPRIIISKDLGAELTTAINECEHDKIFVLTDTNTEKYLPADISGSTGILAL